MRINTLIKQAARKAGVQMTKDSPLAEPNALLAWQARRHGVRTVLDIGANTGQTGEVLRAEGWSGRVVSFEPLPQARGALEAQAAGDPQWIVASPLALGSHEGEVRFNVSANLASSSILQVEQRSVDSAPESGFVEQIAVRVARLDDVIEAAWQAPYAMKIDTQDFELEVLKGAPATLAQTRVVMCEMSLAPLYEGGATFDALYAYLLGEGFACIGLYGGFSDFEAMEMLQVDGVFARPLAAAPIREVKS